MIEKKETDISYFYQRPLSIKPNSPFYQPLPILHNMNSEMLPHHQKRHLIGAKLM